MSRYETSTQRERERESASPVHPVCPPSPSPAGSRRIEPRGEVLPPPTRAAVISRPGTEEDTHDCDQIQGQGQELSICSVTSDICTGAATDRPVMTQVIQTEEIDDRKHPPRDRSPPEDTRLRDKRDSASLDGCEKRTTGDLSSAEHDKISAECFSAQHLADQSLDFELWNEAKTKALRNRHVHDIRMELEQVKNIIKNKSSKPSFLFELKPKEKPQESCFMYEIFCFSQSEIVRQSQSCGLKALRFGLQQGDLSQSTHRKRLFAHLVYEKPENLW